MLVPIFDHLTSGVFFLTLRSSVRQKEDEKFFDILMRVRSASCEQLDVDLLNKRYKPEYLKIIKENKLWKNTPVLTSLNKSVNYYNDAIIGINGSLLGTAIIRSIPQKISKSLSNERKEQKLKRFFKTESVINSSHINSSFKPLKKLVVYPGMPVMLRKNISPSLGLSNGSIGEILEIIGDSFSPHDSDQEASKKIILDKYQVPSVLVSFKGVYKGKVGAVNDQMFSIQDKFYEGRSIVLIEPEVFEGIKGLPLTPAHSISIHKSQSLTLPRIVVDPTNIFCSGALYVALSRAPRLENIMLLHPVNLDILNKHVTSVRRIDEKLQNIVDSSRSLENFELFFECL